MRKIDYWEKFEEGCYYHIYNRGNNGCQLFFEHDNYNYFLRRWNELISPFFDTIAYCLIPNHFHFLVFVKPIEPELKAIIVNLNTNKSKEFLKGNVTYNEVLESQFRRFFSSYSLALNKQQKRTGSLFQKRFKRVSIKSDHKLWYTIAYIHHNPIHHNFVTEFKNWKFSSYNAILSDKQTSVSRAKTLSIFEDDNSTKEFLSYHEHFQIDIKDGDIEF